MIYLPRTRCQGGEAWRVWQVSKAREKETLAPGPAFPLARVARLNTGGVGGVVLLSRDSADTGLRVFNSIQAHELPIIRAAFTGGGAPTNTCCHSNASYFCQQIQLMCDALDHGVAAATVPSAESLRTRMGQLNLHSCDAVLFSVKLVSLSERGPSRIR